MSLCNVCNSLDLKKLPKRPQGHHFYDSENPRDKLARKRTGSASKSKTVNDSPGRVFFSPKHKSAINNFGKKHRRLQSLQSSATTCPLCACIEEATVQFKQNLKKDKDFNDLYGPDDTNYRLWVTKREPGDGDGMQIWTASRKKNRMFFLGAVGLCVDDIDPLNSNFRGRPIQTNPELAKTWSRAQKWITNCDTTHINETPLMNKPLPTRVLDVGRLPSSPIKLITTTGTFGAYTTLSHRWGAPSTMLQTTIGTLSNRQSNIPWNTLPKTFQDAVVITRKLNIPYLWIDSLCIIQDDLTDKDKEVGKMDDVYSNSYLTISASSATSSTVGCFAARSVPTYHNFPYTLSNGTTGTIQASLEPFPLVRPGDRNEKTALQNEVLSTRGWTFQERILSPRTLYYGKRQMYFECMTEFIGEDGYKVTGRRLRVYDRASDKESVALSEWNDLMEQYSTRQLTIPADKLPALAGLAKRMSAKLNTNYLAGIWRKKLLGDLLWSANGGRSWWNPSKYIVPSWSWAAVQQIQSPDEQYRDGKKLAVVTAAKCTPKPPSTNPFGEVESGFITMQAPLIPIAPVRKGKYNTWKFRVKGGKQMKYMASLDYRITTSRIKSLQLYALLIGRRRINSTTLYSALIVTPMGGQKRRYSRVGGMMLVDERALGRRKPSFSKKYPRRTLI